LYAHFTALITAQMKAKDTQQQKTKITNILHTLYIHYLFMPNKYGNKHLTDYYWKCSGEDL